MSWDWLILRGEINEENERCVCDIICVRISLVFWCYSSTVYSLVSFFASFISWLNLICFDLVMFCMLRIYVKCNDAFKYKRQSHQSLNLLFFFNSKKIPSVPSCHVTCVVFIAFFPRCFSFSLFLAFFFPFSWFETFSDCCKMRSLWFCTENWEQWTVFLFIDHDHTQIYSHAFTFFSKFSNIQIRFGKQMKCTALICGEWIAVLASDTIWDRSWQMTVQYNCSDEAKSNFIGNYFIHFYFFSFV